MDIIEVIRSRRSIRRFQQKPVSEEILCELIDIARHAPSAANRQPLEYIIVTEKAQTDVLFDQLAWAAYVQPKRNPPADKRPVAYIIVLINADIGEKWGPIDAAAAIENILLAAWAQGIGTCWLGAIQREKIREIFEVPNEYTIDSVVALGCPDETPVAEDSRNESIESIKYHLDDNDQLHVPKRPLKSILHKNKFTAPAEPPT